ncbi:flavin-containing monooxygenase [Salinisphaera aquimarina]|uniref:Flavin-containing monooxygenase n=1 Tax=Salinisphaera aquimarina TaxID=2094031 RepID=A0ABV7ETJ3_9GAMM
MPAIHSSSQSAPHIVIIGTGFGGLGMAIQLKKAGIDHFTLLEKNDAVGGTWRDNSYPGAACDVESHLYSFSFEPKPDWSRKFARQPEILAYLEDCAERRDLYPHIRFGTEVVAAAYDEARYCWVITTRAGETIEAGILITACGQLNQPAYPAIPGVDDFAGPAFHSARWDHDVDLAGRRVAVIGTGASAIQFVPEVVDRAAHTQVFQRAGAWVMSKSDGAFSAKAKRRFARWPLLARLYRTAIYWKNEGRALAFTRWSALLKPFALMAQRHARRQMRDDDKRRRLMPDYPIGCKRILLSNDWYPAIDRETVDLVTEPIERIERDAVVTMDGKRHPVDVLIHGTGFKATEFLAPMRIAGRGGHDLNAAWQAGARAYKGITVSGFPNFFMLYGPNTNLAHNSIIFMLESQICYVLQGVQALCAGDIASLDVRRDREADFDARIQHALARTVWQSGCTSWYRNAAGRNTVNWPGFTFSFRRATAKLDLSDYHCEHGRHPAGP